MVETNPLKWFVKEIDISDSAKNPTPNKKSSSNQRTEMFGHRPIRTRSRHDCHFSTGSSVPMGNLSPFLKRLTFFIIWSFFYILLVILISLGHFYRFWSFWSYSVILIIFGSFGSFSIILGRFDHLGSF